MVLFRKIINFFRFKPDDSLNKLEEKLLKLEKFDISSEQKSELKSRLFYVIERSETNEYLSYLDIKLTEKIRRIFRSVNIPSKYNFAMKASILDRIENLYSPVANAFSFKFILSSALLFFFTISSVLVFPWNVNLTFAAQSTYIEEAYGEIFVLRNGEVFPAKEGLQLQEADVIITGDKSFVTVRFFDDSTSRLAQNTQMELKRLYTDPFNPLVKKINILLKEGHVWTWVFDLLNQHSEFTISSDKAAVSVSKKAVFDLEVLPTKNVVTVFDNVVDFSYANNDAMKPILAGFQAEIVEDDDPTVIPVPEELHENDNLWVTTNLERDKEYAEKLLIENQQEVNNSNQGSPFNNLEVEKYRLYFLKGYNDFIKGKSLLIEGKSNEGITLLSNFYKVTADTTTALIEFEKNAILDAMLLRSLVENKIAYERREVAPFLLGDALYPAKIILEEIQLLLSFTQTDRALLILSQAEDKLLEVKDLLKQADIEAARQILFSYQFKIDQKLDLHEESDEQLTALFVQQLQHIKILTVIAKSLHEDSTNELFVEIEKLRFDLLDSFIKSLEVLNNEIASVSAQELKDFLEVYIEYGFDDQRFISRLNRLTAN